MNVTLKNVGPNCHEVHIGELILGFSYETIVAFYHPSHGWKASENIWSPTTGKHINMLVGRSYPHTPSNEFVAMRDELLRAVAEGKIRA